MKTFTNHMPGMRGINTAEGTVWIEPGESASIDPKSVVGELPDLGKAPAAAEDGNTELDALKATVADLTKQVETLTGEKAELTKQVETLTKPAK